MLGRIVATQKDNKAVFVQMEQPYSFKMGEIVEVKKHRPKRTISQNRLYFGFLKWCIDNGLAEKGHWSVDGLHSDIKSWIASEYPHQFNVDKLFSSAELNTKEFGEFIDIVDRELMVKFFELETWRFFGDGKSEEKVPF
jgi:hypothetical protein